MKKAILMNSKDNVATLLTEVCANDAVTIFSTNQEAVMELNAKEAIPYGHKIAIKMIEKEALVFKFGEVIGKASRDITAGVHVHVHNIVSVMF